MYGLEGRNAIVTGAAHGIGRAIATRLASEGCHVGILDHDAAAAQAIGAPSQGMAAPSGSPSETSPRSPRPRRASPS
jgi:NAD(P)-dependent dehydrogenase (short-subunit alcohol dehydrogenase family)